MADAILGFRTINKCFLHRYVYEGSPAVLTPKPISLLIPPATAEIDPGISIADIDARTANGAMQTALTYKDKIMPKLKLSFDVGGPELEQLIHGQVVKGFTNVVSAVLFEVEATTQTFAARELGEHGYQVTAQTNGLNSMVYYTDPLTKLSVTLEVVTASPVGNQIVIGEHLALTVSPELAATGYLISGRVNAVVPTATAMSSKQMGLVGVFLTGIYHDQTVKTFSAKYCSLDFGSQLSADGKRSVNLRILPDANCRSGLGWDVEDVPLLLVA